MAKYIEFGDKNGTYLVDPSYIFLVKKNLENKIIEVQLETLVSEEMPPPIKLQYETLAELNEHYNLLKYNLMSIKKELDKAWLENREMEDD